MKEKECKGCTSISKENDVPPCSLCFNQDRWEPGENLIEEEAEELE